MHGQELVDIRITQPFPPDSLQCAVVLQLSLRDGDPGEQRPIFEADRDRDVLGGDAPLHHLDAGDRLDQRR